MAFTVTPTSGDPPYILSAVVDELDSINGVDYVASIGSSISSDSCPTSGTTTYLSPAQVASIIAGVPVTVPVGTVGIGSCRTFTLEITRTSDNVVIASSNAFVDNV